LSNLCRGKTPPVDIDHVESALPFLANLLRNADVDVLVDACWAISHLTDEGDEQALAKVINTSGLCRRLVELLKHKSLNVVQVALRTLANLVTSDDDRQTQVVLDCGALEFILPLLSSPRNSIVREACWMICNITAGNQQQIQVILKLYVLYDF
jgi:hypothetical protein